MKILKTLILACSLISLPLLSSSDHKDKPKTKKENSHPHKKEDKNPKSQVRKTEDKKSKKKKSKKCQGNKCQPKKKPAAKPSH